MYMKRSEKKAIEIARRLPHLRESRENVLAQVEKDLSADEIDSHL